MRYLLLFVYLTALCFQPVFAGEVMELELATLDGSAFVRLTDFPNKAVLINMWGTECPPCIRETPFLNAQAKQYKNVQFIGVATDERIASLRFVSQFQVTYLELQAPKDPSGMLRRFGDKYGSLPYTVMLNPEHRICMRKLGEVDELWISTAAKQCS